MGQIQPLLLLFVLFLNTMKTIRVHYSEIINILLIHSCHPRATDKKVSQLSDWVLIRKFWLLIGKICLPVSLTKRFFSFGNGG